MKDYVNCSECGMTIDSDNSITAKNDECWQQFFCSERHKLQWFERDRFARMMNS